MPTLDASLKRNLAWVIAWLPVLATLAGYFQHALYDPAQTTRIKTLLLVSTCINLVAAVAHALHRRMSLPVAVAGTWVLAALFHAGLAASAAAILLSLCAIGLGSLLADDEDNHGRAQTTALIGLALMTSTAGWLLPFPIHTRLAYSTLAILVVVARVKSIGAILRSTGQSVATGIGELPWAAFAAINIVGVCSTPLWLPTMQADDLSYHLALPFQLHDLGYYRLDVAGSVWAVAPWAADLVQAMGQLLADGEARGAINLAWMLALYAGMWRLCRILGLPALLAWAAIALHASLPLASSLLAGMQTELPTSALVVALAVMIADERAMSGRRLLGIAAIAGMLLALKLSNALLLAPIGVWLLARTRASLPWVALPGAVALGAFVAMPSYVYGWLVAGNPVLPFLNGMFKSPYFALENWKDPMWMQPVSGLLPWQLMFETSRYQTAVDGGAGFAYLFCVPGLLVAMFVPRLRAIALIGVAGFALVFMQIHFIRYTHPAAALLIVGAIGGVASLGRHKALAAAVGVLCALNLSLAGYGFWQIRDGALEKLLESGREETVRRFAPQRIIAGMIREQADAESRVLFHNVDANANAELTIPAYTSSWYNWELVFAAGAADADPSGERWRRLLADRGINLLVVNRGQVSEGLKQALAASTRDPRLSVADFDTWRIAGSSSKPMQLQAIETGGEHATFGYSNAAPNSRVSTSVRFSCDRPDEPIVISIGAQRASVAGQENLISGWAMCKKDGFAEGSIVATTPGDTRALVFIAWPRSPMKFSLLESHSKAETAPPPVPLDPASALRRKLAAVIR